MAAVFTCLLVPGAVWADPQFTYIQAFPFGLSNVGFVPFMDQVDIDGDGDLDVFVGTLYNYTYFFRNTGSDTSPAFQAPVNADAFGLLPVSSGANPTFGDLDGDGDLDVIVCSGSGVPNFFPNNGNSASPSFGTPVTSAFGLSNVPGTMAIADLDGDQDLDVLGATFSGQFRFLENTGNSTSPAFAAQVGGPFGLGSVPDQVMGLDLADIDGDADLDVFASSYYGNTYFFRNTGNPTSPAFEVFVQNPFGLGNAGRAITPLADIDGDSDFDLFLNADNGSLWFYRNTVSDITAPTIPDGIVRLDPSTTSLDAIRFELEFSEDVAPTFTRSDIQVVGTLGGTPEVVVATPTSDPLYRVYLILNNPNANGTVGIQITGVVSDSSGNSLSVPQTSPLYTITHFPLGDVNKSGIFDLADVALLADANLGLAMLP